MSYTFLQQYWWFIVSLLGALLVFLLFVQGANSLVYSLGSTEDGQRKVLESTGRKWEITFTTLVTFGGAFFASFPLFYSTSFGGAYWLWMIILFSFVLQAVSYEFQLKRGNLLGTRTYRYFLILNGIFGPLLLGGAVATFFNGSNFIVDKASLTSVGSPVISRWANASAGLDALLDPWNLMLGLAVMFLARILGTLYIINNVEDEAIRTRGRRQLLVNTVPFLAFFLAFFIRTLLKDGYAVNAETGMTPPFRLHKGDMASRHRCGTRRVVPLPLCGTQRHGLLPLQRRPAELAHHSEQLQQRVYPAGHGYRFRPCAIRLWLHRLRLARHGPQEIACQAKLTCLVRNYL